ncbi:hypothetical protein HCH_03722 [Hahella chejuensis KCTC 2396]|uniref:Uncharacterized protein n=1 Tax=Hahella chejuensis (strain KCTC 2396) TaxID=349521 RepID=Q2SFW6_HAHCH|nr:hypothetical protein HCH_03722 [Hahella chejuensis KCTC 2396]
MKILAAWILCNFTCLEPADFSVLYEPAPHPAGRARIFTWKPFALISRNHSVETIK